MKKNLLLMVLIGTIIFVSPTKGFNYDLNVSFVDDWDDVEYVAGNNAGFVDLHEVNMKRNTYDLDTQITFYFAEQIPVENFTNFDFFDILFHYNDIYNITVRFNGKWIAFAHLNSTDDVVWVTYDFSQTNRDSYIFCEINRIVLKIPNEMLNNTEYCLPGVEVKYEKWKNVEGIATIITFAKDTSFGYNVSNPYDCPYSSSLTESVISTTTTTVVQYSSIQGFSVVILFWIAVIFLFGKIKKKRIRNDDGIDKE
jgi:hypothetical protein